MGDRDGLRSWRNTLARRLTNASLRIATPEYRAWILGSINYGLSAAIEDGKAGRPSPPSWRGLLDDATASGAQIQTMRDLYGKDFK